MKRKIVAALFAALLACMFAACTALANTYTMAFGYELELPEGVEITEEIWTPEDLLCIYRLGGTYQNGEQRFRIQISSAEVIDELEEREGEFFEDFLEYTGIGLGGRDLLYNVSMGLTQEFIDRDSERFELYSESIWAIKNDWIAAGMLGEGVSYTPKKPAVLTATVVTKSSPLKLRETAGNSGRVLAEIPKGDTVVVLEDGDWPRVMYGEQIGYVNGEYLEIDRASSIPEEEGNVAYPHGMVLSDEAGLLSEEEQNLLLQRGLEFERNTGTVVFLLIFGDADMSRESQSVTLNELGVMYMSALEIGSDESVLALSWNHATQFALTMTNGKARTELTDNQKQYSAVQEAMFECFREGRYFEGFMTYLDEAEKYLK